MARHSIGAPLPPWAVREVWLFGDPDANHVEDVTSRFAAKLVALRCHRSQLAAGSVQESQVRERMARVALSANLGAGRLAERFQVLTYA